MKPHFTPGPWGIHYHQAYHSSWLIYDKTGNQLAQVANWQNKGFNIDAERNANLIAVAPEMYEVLEAIIDTITAHDIESLSCDRDGETYCHCLGKRVIEARKVLAKARGE